MAKVLAATCANGVVTYAGVNLSGVTILGEGVGASSGVLILDVDQVYYIPKTSPDLATTLQSLTDALSKIASTMTDIGAGMTGPTTAPPPTLAASVAQINGYVDDLTELMGDLK